MRDKTHLIQEYISLILEDDTGEVLAGLRAAGAGMPGGGGGHGMGAGHALDDIFVKPFTSAFKVTGAEVKKTAVNAMTAGNILFNIVGSTLIPWLKGSYEKIFSERTKKIKQIESEYSQYYSAIWEPYQLNDITVAAFFASPPAMISFFLMKGTPGKIIEAVNILSSGDGVLQSYIHKAAAHLGIESDGILKRSKGSGSREGGSYHYSSSSGDSSAWNYESHIVNGTTLNEDSAASVGGSRKEELEKIFLNPNFINLLNRHTRQMRAKAMNAVRLSLEEILNLVEKSSKFESIDEFERAFIGNASQETKRKWNVAKQQLKDSHDENQLSGFVVETKNKIKTGFMNSLKVEMNNMLRNGVNKDAPIVKLYMSAIEKIGG